MKHVLLLITIVTAFVSPAKSQYFEGVITYNTSFKVSDTAPSEFRDLLTLYTFPYTLFYIKGDSIRADHLNDLLTNPISTYVQLGKSEYQIFQSEQKINRVRYIDSSSHEGDYKIRFLKKTNKTSTINGHKCTLYDYQEKGSSKKAFFWIDESFRFKKSNTGKEIIKDIGLVIKSQLTSPLFNVEFAMLSIDEKKIDKEVFLLPDYYINDFYPQGWKQG